MAWEDDYATTSELGAMVRIGDALDDAQLALAITASSRAIDDRCKRQFGQVAAAEARYYTPRWSRKRGGWLVPIDDLMTTTGLLVAVDQDDDEVYETDLADGWTLRPRNAAAKARPWTELLITSNSVTSVGDEGSVKVTARWGWTAVPTAVKEACLLQSSRLLARRDSPYGVAGSPDAGSEVRLLARLDPDVAVAVEPYRRRAWVR